MDVVREDAGFRVTVGDSTFLLKLKRGTTPNSFIVEVADKPVSVFLLEANDQRVGMVLDGEGLSFRRPAVSLNHSTPPIQPMSTSPDLVAAPMPGKVVGVLVRSGEMVKAGDPLVILESMKMEIAIRTDRDAEVAETLVKEGASVKRGQALVRLKG